MPSPSRRLTTLWFADIAGFTRLSASDEPLALLAMDAMRLAVKSCAAKYHGTVIKFLGDGALAEFPSTESGVEAALELTVRYRGATASMPGGPFQLHIGIHVGDVTVSSDGDIFGDGVNRAARLEHLGAPDQILVSDEVYRLVRKRPELKFTSLGEMTAKGLDEPFEVFEVKAEGQLAERLRLLEKASAAPAPAPTQMLRRRRKNSRAVGMGIVAGVLAFTALGVWTAASRPPANAAPPLALATATLVSGGIPAKLVLPPWDQAFTLSAWPTKAPAAPTAAARGVRPEDVARADRKPTVVAPAALANMPAPVSYADLVASGRSYLSSLGGREVDALEVPSLLRSALDQAVTEEPTPAQKLAIRGLVLFAVEREARGAEGAFRAAFTADPRNALAHLGYAKLLTAWGRTSEVLFQLEEAKKGKGVTGAQLDAARGALLFRESKFDEARDALQRSLRSEDLLATRILLARSLIALDKSIDALKVLDPALGSFEVVQWMSYARLREAGGDETGKTRALAAASAPDAGYAGALILHDLGQTTKAVEALDQLASQKDPDLIWLGVDPEWAPLRGDPDLRRIAARTLVR